mmetsp:Transcript_27436/g.38791  ORF Transcript_27436/g.38791 Transcript_27436/m.38791 type:complete len:133 (-) Transcript_27436:69-467(-)|eukprot:CAMPEP_0175099778 /NCGR_PEP_ID=MMETSP0086_2-20121207/6658_1 /TAXON_ID=136419 /ORGANISM="Unknown Unknown, Strain D1" /LENGTH=132 /DNA_ID=CAMNT_0016373691 /DNA_START=27 /DNA_END=425 /DNA_ORIENTATION=+
MSKVLLTVLFAQAAVVAQYLKVDAYNSADCSGTAVFSQTFDGSCTSLNIQGNTYYGKAGCDSANTNPFFSLCSSSDCGSCQPQSLVGSGQCGNGFGVFTSARGTCQASSSSAVTTAVVALVSPLILVLAMGI